MKNHTPAKIVKHPFGETADRRAVELYTLTNGNDMEVKISTFGGTVVSLDVPDRRGRLGDVVLGYDDLNSYESGTSYFGAIIGRYANRIAEGKFNLGGTSHTLAQNNDSNHLHGGPGGFHTVVWTAQSDTIAVGARLRLAYTSRDMEEGYPGNLEVRITYTLTEEDSLKIEYVAETDKETILNLTNHSYFNLAGNGGVLDHELRINADRFTPIDETFIPTGELRPVRGTLFDFTSPTRIGAHIEDRDEQLLFGKGYDHNWALNKTGDAALTLAAEVYEPMSGRVMQVMTTQPGLQFYSGNFLKDEKGKGGAVYQIHEGFCLETQHFPDSPNKPHFPSTTIKPGETYEQTTIYKFSIK